MKNLLTIAILSFSLAGCSVISKLLPTPGVNANVQAGKENTQQAVVNQENIKGETVTVSKVDAGSQIEVKEIAALNQTIQNIPPWVLLLLVLGWVLPTPLTIFKSFLGLFKRKKTKKKK